MFEGLSIILGLATLYLITQTMRYRSLYKESCRNHKTVADMYNELNDKYKSQVEGGKEPFWRFQEDITRYVEEQGITYAELSRKLNADRSYISAIVNGRSRPSLEKAMEIVFELGFTQKEVEYYEQHLFPHLQRKE